MTIRYINTNVNSIRALQNLRTNINRTDKAANTIASGKRINQSSDDASGYAISQRVTADILTGTRSLQNIQDGLSILDVTEGSLGVMNDNLQRIRELAVGMASDVNSITQRTTMAKEMRSLLDDINRVSDAANFNGTPLLDGTLTEAKVQTGGGSNIANNTVDIASAFIDTDTIALGLEGVVAPPRWTPATLDDIFNGTTTQLNSSERILSYMEDIDSAIKLINERRATIGALSNQLSRNQDYLELNVQNLTISRSRIEDTDVAKASAEYTQAQVLQQAAVSILSQANTSNQDVLQLLQR
jgi:flagellin